MKRVYKMTKTQKENTAKVVDYSSMTKDEIIAELNSANEKIKSGQTSRKDQVMTLLESGIQTIQEIAAEMNISAKNVSSNLTYLRDDLKATKQTILSHKMNNKTYLKIIKLSDFGWDL